MVSLLKDAGTLSIIPGVTDTLSIDVLLATLSATEVGSLEAIAERMEQVRRALESMGQTALALAAADGLLALRRGNVAEFRRSRAFLQSKIGHLR
jgi:hypothetical protein